MTLGGIVLVCAVAAIAMIFKTSTPAPRVMTATSPAPAAARTEVLPSTRGRESLGTPELRERARQAVAAGSLDQAKALLDRALALDRSDSLTWNDLGVVLVRRGQRSQGIAAFQRSLALDGRHADTHRNLAVALDQDGQNRMAATHYRAVLDLAPRHPERGRIEARLASLPPATDTR